MSQTKLEEVFAGVREGNVFPYLGPGVLENVVDVHTGESIPADGESLILAMNGGKPMAPKLMYEFPRAAMNLELKKGRTFVNRFLTQTYDRDTWSESSLHHLLAELKPSVIIDINRDTQLQQKYAGSPHVLIVGIARIGGTDYRFKLYRYEEGVYTETAQETVTDDELVLFKPIGTPLPEPNYIASDADYVDYITELMGGFAIPSFLKERRQQKQYVMLGVRLTRDTERMVFTDIIYGAGEPAGWAVIESPTDKERRFCEKQNIEIVEASMTDVKAALENAAGVGV